jgi:tetratricopeptide (TPR) repeat protein
MHSSWWCGSLALCGWLLTAGASAQQRAGGAAAHVETQDEGVARGLYQAGKAAYEAGRYEQALGYFEQAYEQSKRPRMLYNIGQAADRLRRDERALEAFREFLRVLPDDPVREEVEMRIAALERAVAERQRAEQATPAAPIVTPAAAAETVAPASSADAVDSAFDERSIDSGEASQGGVLTKWWFWGSVGVALAGGATVLVLVLAHDDPKTKRPIAGDVGGVVQTLGMQGRF